MVYQMAATIVTLDDLGRYLSVAGLFKCNPSNPCATIYTISTDMCSHGFSALAELLLWTGELTQFLLHMSIILCFDCHDRQLYLHNVSYA